MATIVVNCSSEADFGSVTKDQLAVLATLSPNVSFVKVEAERVPALSERFDINVVPTFVFVQGEKTVDKLEGTNVAELAKKVDSLSKMTPLKRDSKSKNGGSESSINDRLRRLVVASPAMLFMKGTPSEPRCGFSRQMVDMLNQAGIAFGSFDIFADDEVRQGLKAFSNWPTYPQLYVRGKLIGGLDIVKELKEEGDLKEQLGIVDTEEEGSLESRLLELTVAAPVMLFMKGTPQEPKCGFSRKIVQILRDNKIPFSTFDILSDDEVRQGLKKFSNWPTYPQLYVKGKLIGGLDIVTEMADESDLAEQLGVDAKKAKTEDLNERLKNLINKSRVMVFMKGNANEPKCGFSKQLVEILRSEGFEFDSFDILSDEKVRQGLKNFSNWPTYPQLYVDGQLIGGLDIVKEMQQEGELSALRNKAI